MVFILKKYNSPKKYIFLSFVSSSGSKKYPFFTHSELLDLILTGNAVMRDIGKNQIDEAVKLLYH